MREHINEPALLTMGRIAESVGAPLHRVAHILRTRGHIRPAARAGTLRLYRRDAIAQVCSKLDAIKAGRRGRSHDAE